MYKIVFLDIDGTLVNEDKIIPKCNVEAVQKLKQNGFEVVLATGRPPYHFDFIKKQLGIDSFVSCNGAYTCYKGKTIQATAFDKKHIKKLLELSKENNHPLVFSSHEKTVSNAKDHQEIIESFDYLKINYSPDFEPYFWKKEEIYQIMLYCKEHEEPFYHQAIKELSFVRWHPYSVDVIPPNVSKVTGIKAVLNHLGFKRVEAIAFGDGLNDREMLNFVGMGIAMGNAHDKLKPHADMVTRSVDNGGISFALNQLQII
ncbi:Cof-type HAD-IIB family hydrolase [Caldibacillus thermoamylovorans]|uniref:Cof-type HAD-IIB family hydrolase n=1 Tax=Caldibacillus thermoamylovorans TaxID=35841 RepID=UPI0025599B33|nr:Cof-type HAD-IIB family hydrolase [Caldibacillus thermoamylovorans]